MAHPNGPRPVPTDRLRPLLGSGDIGNGFLALDKLGVCRGESRVEPVASNTVFDVASLFLYGCSLIPTPLKVLLDRLFSVLPPEDVLQILRGFGWSPEDYDRGYVRQDPQGGLMDSWNTCTREEEPLILEQFLRFGETRKIAQRMLGQLQADHQPRGESDIKKFLERASHGSVKSEVKCEGNLGSPPSLIFPGLPHGLTRFSPGGAPPAPAPPPNFRAPFVPPSPLNKLQSMQPFDFRLKEKLEEKLPLAFPPSLHGPVPTLQPNNQLSISNLIGKGSSSTGSSSSTPIASKSEDPINLSRSAPAQPMSHVHAGVNANEDLDRNKHLRKSSNPIKRRWDPISVGTSLMNPSTGKKRVQCNVCLKTFCDKGALKIHFSAVHLREMHKCTVEGCNMMFSSRRSRNRHSANPNPKLHTPHLRRKISPHDGRTAQAHAPPGVMQIPHGLLNSLNPLNPFGLPPGFNALSSAPGPLDLGRSLDLRLKGDGGGHHHGPFGGESQGSNLISSRTTPSTTSGSPPAVSFTSGDNSNNNGSKRMRLSDCSDAEDDEDLDDGSNLDDSPDDEDEDEDDADAVSMGTEPKEEERETLPREELVGVKGVRKRKSRNPTRYGIAVHADDLTQSSDDLSSDALPSLHSNEKASMDPGEEPKHENHPEPKKDSPSEKDRERDKDNVEESENKENDGDRHEDAEQHQQQKGEEENKEHKDGDEDEEREEGYEEEEEGDEDDEYGDDRDDDSERGEGENESVLKTLETNALKHLESLSQGNFGDFVSRNLLNAAGPNPYLTGPGGLGLPFGLLGSPGFPPHPPLPPGLAQTPSSTSPNKDNKDSGDTKSNPDSPSSDSAGYPPFRDSGFISSLDVPVDKENPRRCPVCGKVFQNHFGVKTHYQNVHLKLMHKCTVEGCNAAFPSKRSRDRHSANLNLHRKLLSTSDKMAPYIPGFSAAAEHQMRTELLARMYAEHPLQGFYSPEKMAEQMLANGEAFPRVPAFPGFMFPCIPSTGAPPPTSLSFGSGGGRNSTPSPPTSVSSGGESDRGSNGGGNGGESSDNTSLNCNGSALVYSLEEDLPTPDPDGNLPCRFCQKSFPDGSRLKEHYESLHSPEMFRCTVPGCNKIFSSQKKRNAHSANPELHKTMQMQSCT
ncbi:unnamed protein product [Darwinula stevensoni]|uniref:C2H2-type domain-containing protein n=1 Tax=Darwinula stevensoni TaxID=69355 RepID=A0A7R9A6B5_9CRUS|nr:unnamed protein product [Darwinula stevensoni]CAG0887269.1 unnamed protein product [Darwinula stevensoni]